MCVKEIAVLYILGGSMGKTSGNYEIELILSVLDIGNDQGLLM